MERTDQQPQQPSPAHSGYTPDEITAAASLRADARARINDIATRTQTATAREEHTQLGRERALAFGDYMAAGFVLTEGADA